MQGLRLRNDAVATCCQPAWFLFLIGFGPLGPQMERGTRDLLEQAEGRGQTSRGDSANSEDDIFGFAQKSISEDTLRELRRQNENNMAVAMASLKGNVSVSALPAVYGANRLGPVRRQPRRKQPGITRPQTPSEVRDAAEREVSERELDQQRISVQKRQPRHRPLGQQQPQQQHGTIRSAQLVVNGSGSVCDTGGGHKVPMTDESNALFNLLDWQKECRVQGVDSTSLLNLHPRGMYDKEFRRAESALNRHNRILRAYLTAAAAPSNDLGDQGVAMHDSRQEDASSVVPEHSVISNTSAAPSQIRARREQRLQALLAEARELRNRSLAIVHQGGVDIVHQVSSLQQISPAGRNMLQVLHSLLETGLSDEMGLQEAGAHGAKATRNVALRNMLLEMQARNIASRRMQVGKKRAYDDARLLPSHNRQKRERDWQMQVRTYSSWDDGSSDDSPKQRKKDNLNDQTMMLLRASDRWMGEEGQEAGVFKYRKKKKKRVYVYTYINTNKQMYVHTYMHKYINTHMHINIQTQLHYCIHIYIHACIHTYICCMHAYIQTNTKIYVCVHVHIYIYTYIYINIFTYT